VDLSHGHQEGLLDMKKSFLLALMLCAGLGQLAGFSVPASIPESFGKGHIQRETPMPDPKPMQADTTFPLQEEPTNSSSSRGEIDHVNATHSNTHPPTGQKAAAETAQRVSEAYNCGLTGTTSFVVMSGVPGGQSTGGPRSIEFAITPIEGDKPAYDKAIFVKSDYQGKYEVALPPGTYWIGPKAKALDPVNYRPRAVVFSEKLAVVKEGVFTHIDLVETGYAP
jgi:hypothetical protein